MSLIKKNNFFEDWFKTPFSSFKSPSLQTNVKAKDDRYLLEIEIPGFKKEDIKLSLENGYLTVEVEKEQTNENYIRKERAYGKMSRSFYIGDITIEEVKANYNNGILLVEVPKEQTKEVKKNYIEIK